MTFEIISAVNIKSNLKDYTATYNTFNWQETEKNFTWYNTNKVNIAYEAIDRHANSNRRNKIALHYKDFYRTESYTFFDLMELSNRAGNILKTKANVKKGDNVFIFMPRTPELYILLLGTVKLGAIIGPLFEIFMEDALRVRLENSQAKVLITTPELLKRVPLTDLPSIESIVLVGENIEEKNKFIDYYKEMKTVSRPFDLEWVDREDGYIIHYTSGSTGKPKGVCLTHNSMIQLYQTAKWVLDLKDDDIYWCTADPGWVTGTTYGILAPWLLGVTSVVTGDRFNPDVWYKLIEEYNVNVWYSAPTAFRMLMGANEEVTNKYDLSSLRNILSVGEPLNPEVIRWALKVFRLPIHDTWFMTETGAQIICNYPCMDIRLGSMGKPIPGIEAAIVDNNGKELPPLTKGNLAIKKYWPSIMRMIWQNKEKYDSYFIEDWYISGDSAYMDE
ncbi:MAG: AMP-binding protein, partial [Vulcanibacillus sp.]